jgi:hypothetical protein
MHFYSVYYKLTAATCFENYLLIFRRCYTNSLYIVCVLYVLAVTRVEVGHQFQFNPGKQPTDLTLTQYTNCLWSAS